MQLIQTIDNRALPPLPADHRDPENIAESDRGNLLHPLVVMWPRAIFVGRYFVL